MFIHFQLSLFERLFLNSIASWLDFLALKSYKLVFVIEWRWRVDRGDVSGIDVEGVQLKAQHQMLS